MISLKGKCVIVTGAASGIGLGTARILARRGASVVLADIDGEAAEISAHSLCKQGLSAVAVETDVSDEGQIRRMIQVAVQSFGGLDALHSNAALMAPSAMAQDESILDLNADHFLRVLGVNLVGCALGAKHAIPHMLRRGGGTIINTASVAATSAERMRAMYAASKGGIISFTRNVAAQFGKQGIRAVSISPGFIETPAASKMNSTRTADRFIRHTALGRPGKPDDIGNLVAFLVSDEGSFITGIDIVIDGGLTSHFPTFAEELDDERC